MKTTVFVNEKFNLDIIISISILYKKHKSLRVIKAKDEELDILIKANPEAYFLGFNTDYDPENRLYSSKESGCGTGVSILTAYSHGFNPEGLLRVYFENYYVEHKYIPASGEIKDKIVDILSIIEKSIVDQINNYYQSDTIEMDGEYNKFHFIANRLIDTVGEIPSINLSLDELIFIEYNLSHY